MTTQEGEAGSTAERVERLLLEARLLQRRGQSEEAIARCQQALDLDAQAWEAHEVVGDVLLAQGRAADALERYRAAHAIVPEQASVEEKMARATLAQAQRDWLREGVEPLGGDAEAAGPPRNPGIAALLSLVVPGLGQAYNRQPIKGVIILGLALVLWIIVAFQMIASLHGLASGAGAARVDVLQALFTARNLVWLALILLIWFYSIADAALIAARPTGQRRDII